MNRMRNRLPEIAVFLTLLACYAYFFPRWADWNQNSRLDLTMAIVEQRSFSIDDYYENTGDYAVYDGHIYTDKAPGSSFLGVPVYFAFRQAANTVPVRSLLTRLSSSEAFAATLRSDGTGLLNEKVYFAAALYVVTFFTVSLPSALLGGLLYHFLGRLLASPWKRTGLILAYGLATVAFPYSSLFYGHQMAAVLLFASVFLLYRMRQGELSLRWFWAVGAMLGSSVLVEFPTLLPAVGLALYAAWFLRRSHNQRADAILPHLVRMGLAGLPFLLLLGFYNNACFGSPFTSSYKYLGNFPEISNTGFLGFSAPRLQALWGITFSPYRGLFFMSPFLLLALPGFWYGLRDTHWRSEAVLFLSLTAVHLGLVSAWYDWRGGFSLGPRNLITILPFLTVAIAFCLREWEPVSATSSLGARPTIRAALSLFGVWGLILLSFAVTWIIAVSGQELPPITVGNPLVDFSWPKFARGDIARNLGMVLGLRSWFSLAPILLFMGGMLWMLRVRPLRGDYA